MSANRIPLSVRIDQEEADFIAQLSIEGASTPSEKIRELLKQARMSHETVHDYSFALDEMERLTHPAKHRVLHAEKELGVHSAILTRLFELLPDMMATLATDLPESPNIQQLREYEEKNLWRIVRLMDAVLQLAIVGKGAAYDDKVLQHLDNTLKLAAIVQQARQPE